jgi:hypothetical protein
MTTHKRDYNRARIKTAVLSVRVKPEDKAKFEHVAAFRRRTLTNWLDALGHADYEKALAEGMPPYIPAGETEGF